MPSTSTDAAPPPQPLALSPELLDRLRLHGLAKDQIHFSRWFAHIEIALDDPHAIGVHPAGFGFLREALSDRYAGIAQNSERLLVSYLVESDAAETHDLARRVAEEIAGVLRLGPLAVTAVEVTETPHLRPGGPLRPVT